MTESEKAPRACNRLECQLIGAHTELCEELYQGEQIRDRLARKVFRPENLIEADSMSPEDLEAAADMYDQLIAGTFYEKNETALNEMFGTNLNRRIYLPDKPKGE